MKRQRRSTEFLRVAVIGLAGVCFIAASPSQAATKTVDIIDYAFSPATVTINVNDTVHWVWQADLHTSTAGTLVGPDPDAGLWDSGLFNTGHTFDFTFTNAGTFPYYCSYHSFPGSVTVQGGATASPPTVAITSPPSGAVRSAPATISLAATASEPNGSIANVEFFNGSSSLGQVLSAPFSVVVQNLAAGGYAFSAVATDANSQKATNSIIVHVVASSPMNLSAPQFPLGGPFRFSYATTTGLTYVIDRSDALGSWHALNTNMASAGGASTFEDTGASGTAQFYRVRLLPNP